MRHYYFLILLMVFPMKVYPQLDTKQADTSKWIPPEPDHYSFIHYDENVISNSGKLDSVFKKLIRLRNNHKGRVNIIHIGDSHIQADGITSVVRGGFQDFFGDAGRGLVFPYQLANTNAPHDIHAVSNDNWHNSRVTNGDASFEPGISGFAVQSAHKNAFIRLSLNDPDLRQSYFNRMVLFLGKDGATYELADSNIKTPLTFTTQPGIDTPSFVFNADTLLTSFQLTRTDEPGQKDFAFYGASLERRDTGGVLYHAIGVNGARYEQYVNNDLLWKQLSALHGDLFIISLGTNEAQNPHVDELQLISLCEAFIQKIHKIAPKAMVVITTPAPSYFRMKRPNTSLQTVTHAFTKFCDEKRLPYWNLYAISGGKTGAAAWKQRGLLSNDLVHYNQQGYKLQGQLLLDALSKAYNKYASLHPYKPEPPAAPVIIVRKGTPVKKQPVHTQPQPSGQTTKKIEATPAPLTPKWDSIPPVHLQPPKQSKQKSRIIVSYDN
jgi:lysophospholipase L1-like esterase